jgi:hypothetical protein
MAAGAQRIIAGSFALIGAAPAQETSDPNIDRAAEAVRSMESQIIAAACRRAIEGIVLRYGLFYGPGNPATAELIARVRKRRLPRVRNDRGTPLHAAATVVEREGTTGSWMGADASELSGRAPPDNRARNVEAPTSVLAFCPTAMSQLLTCLFTSFPGGVRLNARSNPAIVPFCPTARRHPSRCLGQQQYRAWLLSPSTRRAPGPISASRAQTSSGLTSESCWASSVLASCSKDAHCGSAA